MRVIDGTRSIETIATKADGQCVAVNEQLEITKLEFRKTRCGLQCITLNKVVLLRKVSDMQQPCVRTVESWHRNGNRNCVTATCPVSTAGLFRP